MERNDPYSTFYNNTAVWVIESYELINEMIC